MTIVGHVVGVYTFGLHHLASEEPILFEYVD